MLKTHIPYKLYILGDFLLHNKNKVGGQYVQFIRKNHTYDFLKVSGDNFAKVDAVIQSKDYRKLVFPNYILKKIIKDAEKMKISISSIEFYGDISQDAIDNIDEFIEKKQYKKLLQFIDETNLNIRKIGFYDLKERKFSALFSNGIAWMEDYRIVETVLENIIPE